MKNEDFKKAIELNKRLEELEEARDIVYDNDYYLLYATNKSGELAVITIRAIKDILERHECMICNDVDEEIRKIKKQIEEL
jgi:hypothetical protein